MKSSTLKCGRLPSVLAVLLLFCLVFQQAMRRAQGSKPGPTPSIPVTSTIDDNDSSNPGACLLPGQAGTQPNECLFRSDAAGAYTSSGGVISEIYQTTYWSLNLSGQTSRTAYVTFSNNWTPASGRPATPPLSDGLYPMSVNDTTAVISRCYTSSSGTEIINFLSVTTADQYCSLRIEITHKGTQYLYVMAPIFPGTGWATVVCNQVSSGACTDATITPTPASLGAQKANVAYLYSINPKSGKQTLLGSAFNSFLIHVTNP
jgi:hypothetical protein